MRKKISFSKYEIFVVGVLTFLQFTIILDFMILSPLGAFLMKALNINPAQFGMVVSAYAFSAAVSGVFASGFADRYDRKKLLLFFYIGFIISTLLCGLANSFEFLLVARIFTGLFGGVIGSIVLAITTDLFPLETRGRVMGFIQTAFAGSQIVGIPFGLYLANLGGWHMPFFLLVGLSSVSAVIIWKWLKPIDHHLHLKKPADKHAFHHMWETLANKKYLQAFVTVSLLSLGGFMIMPFGSAFNVHNLEIDIKDLPLIYMVTGGFTFFMGPLVGRASDYFGKYQVFVFGSLITGALVIYYTHMGPTTTWFLMLVNIFMFLGITARIISSQALLSAIPSPDRRGSFMSINASVQQLAGGVGSMLAGALVTETATGHLEHFDQVGYVVSATTLLTMVMMYFIHLKIKEKTN